MGIQFIVEAIKFFENIKPSVEGLAATGPVLAASAKAGVYVIKKGAKLVSYLITDQKDAERLPTVKKADVVILVDINRRMLADVSRYLEEKKLDADVVIISNDPAYSDNIQFLKVSDSEDWVEIVKEFTSAMNGIKRTVGGAKMHIFLSTPLPLAFALGSVWGTVDETATVYHWEKGTYYPVMPISRELRIGK
jgi:hypothetical protein